MTSQDIDINHEERAALIIIDVQQALFEKTTPIPNPGALLQTINRLIKQAHEREIPVFFFRHANKSFLAPGSAGWNLHTDLHPSASDIVLEKQHGSAFQDTPFDQELHARKVTRLIVTGLVTNGCVRATCEAALKRGYAVTVVKDGHSTYQKGAAAIIEEWNQRFSEQGIEVVMSDDILN